jgi:4-alpha-glucanotransferase
MKADSYAWWQERLRHTLASFDRVRIDHFRAFASYYYIPATAEDARTGHWCPGPGEALIDRLREVAGEGQIVAEDLGGEAPEVKALLQYSGFPGMRVFQFGFLSEENSSHLPHNYEKNTATYTGTHDNDTLLGYLFSLSEGERRRIFDYCGYAGSRIEEGIGAIIRTMYGSHADLLVLPVQDLLRFGEDTRINRPGTPRGNWTYRVTEEQLASIDWPSYRRLAALYGR